VVAGQSDGTGAVQHARRQLWIRSAFDSGAESPAKAKAPPPSQPLLLQPALAAAGYDPFAVQKAAAFSNSIASVADVATSALPVVEAAAAAGPAGARDGLFQVIQVAC
jgi:hypothetical protein